MISIPWQGFIQETVCDQYPMAGFHTGDSVISIPWQGFIQETVCDQYPMAGFHTGDSV